jgi:hypothetical protein
MLRRVDVARQRSVRVAARDVRHRAAAGAVGPPAASGPILPLIALLAICAGPVPAQRVLTVPRDLGESSLGPRAAAQRQAAASFGTFVDFSFADRITESGIRFEQTIVDDVGRDYKAIHYDHGNGVAVADVDLDGRLDVYLTTQLGANGLWLNRGSGTFEDGTRSLAEGVETMEHASIMRDLGCTVLQGFAFAKPMPGRAFTRFAKQHAESLKAAKSRGAA